MGGNHKGVLPAASLLTGEIGPREVRALRQRAAAIVIVVALSVGLAWVNTTAAKYCWLLIPIVQFAAEHRSARAAARSAPAGTRGH